MNHQYQILEGRPCQSSHQKDFIPIVSSYEATCFLEVGLQAFDFYWLIGWGWELHNPTVTLPRKQHQRGLHSDRILGGQESLRIYASTPTDWSAYLSAFNLFPENLSNTTVISPVVCLVFCYQKIIKLQPKSCRSCHPCYSYSFRRSSFLGSDRSYSRLAGHLGAGLAGTDIHNLTSRAPGHTRCHYHTRSRHSL